MIILLLYDVLFSFQPLSLRRFAVLGSRFSFLVALSLFALVYQATHSSASTAHSTRIWVVVLIVSIKMRTTVSKVRF